MTTLPEIDELKDRPDDVRCLVAKLEGWTCISPSYLVGLAPHRSVSDYSAEQIMGNRVPIDPLPEYEKSHDACRTFEDAMSDEEFADYVDYLWNIVSVGDDFANNRRLMRGIIK